MDDFIRAFMGLPTRGEPPRFYGQEDNHQHNNFQDPDIDRFFGGPPPRVFVRPFFFGGSFGDPHQGGPFGDPHQGSPFGDPNSGGPFGDPNSGGPFGDPHRGGHRENHPFQERGGMHSDNNDMFRHIDDMFRSFDGAFRNMGVASHPSIEYRQKGREQNDSLRDKMLKNTDPNPYADRRRVIIDPGTGRPSPTVIDPSEITRRRADIHPSEKQDRDIDAEVKDGDLDAILGSMNSPAQQQVEPLRPQIKSHFKSVSIRTYRGPDGKYEQEKTTKDGEGNVEKVVTKRLGEQEHSVISKSDRTGIKEKVENFVNMDEGDKPVFEKLWETPGRKPSMRQIQPPSESVDPDSQSMFSKLFGTDLPFFKSK